MHAADGAGVDVDDAGWGGGEMLLMGGVIVLKGSRKRSRSQREGLGWTLQM